MVTRVISALLFFLVVTARGQSVDPPTNVRATLDNSGTEVIVSWSAPAVSGGSLSYRLRRITAPQDTLAWVKPDTAVINDIQDWTWYNDHGARACYRYTYTVVAIWKMPSGENVESQTSEKAELLIKGGVNAVVIFPTPEAVAVAGSPFELLIRACDRDPAAVLSYSLYGAAPGMTVDPKTGLITWQVPADVAGAIYSVKVKVKDNFGAYASAYISFRVIDEVSFTLRGALRVGGGQRLFGNASVMLISSTTFAGIQTTTDSNGSFIFKRLGRGSYKLAYQYWFYDHGWWHWYKDATGPSTATIIELRDIVDESLDTIVIPTFSRNSAKLAGKLTDGALPIANASVSAIAIGTFFRSSKDVSTGQVSVPQLQSGEAVRTGSDGRYSVNVDSGRRYALLASRPGYRAQFIGTVGGGCATPFCATQFTPQKDTVLSDGSLSQSDTAAQQIVGTVTSLGSNGNGVRAMILLSKLKDGTITSGYSGGLVPFDVISSDTMGNFEIRSIPRDADPNVRYILQAIPFAGHVPAFYTNGDTAQLSALWEWASPFALDSHKVSPLQVDVHVQPLALGAGVISGSVRLKNPESGAPVQNAIVYAVSDISGSPQGFAITDASGSYAIGNLPLGTYRLLGDKVGYQHGSKGSVTITERDSGVNENNNLVLLEGGSGVYDGLLFPSSSALGIFPNPAVTYAVAASHRPLTQVVVQNVLGQIVADWTSLLRTPGSATLDVSRFPAGSYLVVVRPAVGPVLTVPLHIVR
jgi:hypothetical protein